MSAKRMNPAASAQFLPVIFILGIVLFLTGCSTISTLQIPRNQPYYYPEALEGINRTTIVVQDISKKDFGNLVSDVSAPDGPAIRALKRLTKITDIILSGGFNLMTGGAQFGFANEGRWTPNTISGLMVITSSYNQEKSMGIIRVGVMFNTESPVGVKLEAVQHLRYTDAYILQEINSNPTLAFKGYYIETHYRGKNRTISGTVSGGISINILLDSNSKITVGGLVSKTDDEGKFSFSGEVKLGKIADGIITLVNTKGESVTVLQDDAGLWYVQIEGQKSGKPYSDRLIMTALNNK